MRNKLGIIQLELPDITLSDSFTSGSATEITSLLNEEQKEIIKNGGGSKLVLLKCKLIKDNNDDEITDIYGILNKFADFLSIRCYVGSLTSYVDVSITHELGVYYIYA